MKIRLSFRLIPLATLVLLVVSFFVVHPVLAFDGGNGSSNSPYQISTCTELEAMGSYLSSSFVLTGNVSCSGTSFTPVGSISQPFTGTLNGANYTISSLSITNSNANNPTGLFGGTSGATIENLVLASPTISSQGSQAAALIGEDGTASTITKVSVTGGSVTGGNEEGGLIGQVTHGTSISDSSYSGTISIIGTMLDPYVGGLIGEDNNVTTNTATLTNNYTQATISGSNVNGADIGGFIGYVPQDFGAAITKSYASGSITVTGTSASDSIGGMLGYLGGSSGLGNALDNDFSAVQISSDATGSSVAAIVGTFEPGNTYFDYTNSYFDEYLAGTSACVTGETFLFHGCGAVNSGDSQSSYFDNNSSNAPLNGWDFTNTWATSSSLPIFVWQVVTQQNNSNNSSNSGSSQSSSSSKSTTTKSTAASSTAAAAPTTTAKPTVTPSSTTKAKPKTVTVKLIPKTQATKTAGFFSLSNYVVSGFVVPLLFLFIIALILWQFQWGKNREKAIWRFMIRMFKRLSFSHKSKKS